MTILLGIIQGFAEFLPISSSAHLAVAGQLGERFFGWPDQGLGFDIALHVGTLIAVLAYFLKDWIQVIGQAFGIKAVQFNKDLARNTKLLWLLVIAVFYGVIALLASPIAAWIGKAPEILQNIREKLHVLDRPL